MRLVLVWLVNALALLALPYVFPGVKVDTFGAALIAARSIWVNLCDGTPRLCGTSRARRSALRAANTTR